MMLTKADVPFEDCRLTFAEWPAMKTEMIKSSGFGGLPILEFPDGMRMYQSIPINDYVAGISGFRPTDPMQRYNGYMLFEAIMGDIYFPKI